MQKQELTPNESRNRIKTFTGEFLDPLNPEPDQIHIEDIARALSFIPRFAGHTKKFYSVAEHCLRCAKLIAGRNYELEVLLHDATEAYLLDMPSPIKHRLPDYVHAERKLSNTIDIAFGLYSVMHHDLIKEVDLYVLQEELHFLMNCNEGYEPNAEAEDWYNTNRTMFQIEQEFLSLFKNLSEKKYPTRLESKAEKIRFAYRNCWDLVKDFVDENGRCMYLVYDKNGNETRNHPPLNELGFFQGTNSADTWYDSENYIHYWRPTELNGIEKEFE